MPNIISEFRQRYPQYNDIPDAQVFMKLAAPGTFKQAFPEYADMDDHLIGKNLAAEAGKVAPGKPWYKEAWDVTAGIGKSALESLKPGVNQLPSEEEEQARRKEFETNVKFRKEAGYSLPYRATANTLEGLGIFSTAPMEQAAAKGYTGEVLGQAAIPAAMVASPLAIRGVRGIARSTRNLAMEKPVIARQRAMNVPPKSRQAIRAVKEGTTAAPYLKGAKNLQDIQARIPAAKQEIFQPYMDAVDRAGQGGRTLNGPEGPVSPRALEELRQETSAQLQSTRKMQPTEQWTAVQKNQQIAELTRRYRQIIDELDPAIRDQGIDPKRTRATFGAVKGVEKKFEGRSTLLEGKPSGLGRMAQVDLTKPLKEAGNIAAGTRDIAAGRGWFSQKPTDVQVREGFRTAAPKPDLTVQPQPPARGLPPGPLVTPPPEPEPLNLTPPPVAPTSRAQRLGLLLPEQSVSSARPQIPTGYIEPAAPGAVSYVERPPAAVPPVPIEPPTGQPANMRIVRDPKTGQMKRQYLTSGGGEIVREAPAATAIEPKIFVDSIGVKWAETPEGVRVSIPKSVTEADVMKYAQDKLAHQAEMQKGVKSQTTSPVEPIKRIDEIFEQTGDFDENGLGAYFVSREGKIGGQEGISHSQMLDQSGLYQKESIKMPTNVRENPEAWESLVQDYIGKTGDLRIQSNGDYVNVNSIQPVTQAQIQTILKLQRKLGVPIIFDIQGKTGIARLPGEFIRAIKESSVQAAKSRGTELQAGRIPPGGERRLSSPKQRELFDRHQSAILDLKERLRQPGITQESKSGLQNMIKEHQRAMEAVKRGDPAEMARDFGPIKFSRAGKMNLLELKSKPPEHLFKNPSSHTGKPIELDAYRASESPTFKLHEQGTFFAPEATAEFGDHIYKVKIKFNNPLVAEDGVAAAKSLNLTELAKKYDEFLSGMGADATLYKEWEVIDNTLKQAAKKAGYDGVIFTSHDDLNPTQYIVIDPKAIITQNKIGKFDSKTGNVVKEIKGITDIEEEGEIMPLVQPMPVPRFQFFDANGDPVANGFLYTYEAGTNTPLATYNDHTGGAGALNPNPVELDSGGYADVWLTAASYKLVLEDSNHVQIWSIDGVPGLGSLISVGDLPPLFTSVFAAGGLSFVLSDAAPHTLFGRFAGTTGAPSFGAIGSDGQISYNNGGEMAGDSDLIWSDVPANKQLLLVAGVLRFGNLTTGAKIQDQATSLDIASRNIQDIRLGSIGDENSRFRMGTSNSGQFFFQIASGPVRLNLNDGLNAAGVFRGPAIVVGQGTPENQITARVGSLFLRTDGGAGTTLYVKEANTDDTGWQAK